VLTSLEICWHSYKEQFKSVDKLRKLLTFYEGAVKKVLASLEIEMFWHLLKELLKKCWQAWTRVGISRRSC